MKKDETINHSLQIHGNVNSDDTIELKKRGLKSKIDVHFLHDETDKNEVSIDFLDSENRWWFKHKDISRLTDLHIRDIFLITNYLHSKNISIGNILITIQLQLLDGKDFSFMIQFPYNEYSVLKKYIIDNDTFLQEYYSKIMQNKTLELRLVYNSVTISIKE
jgi:hypothetical protein